MKLELDIDSIKGYDNIINFFKENKDVFKDSNRVISFDIETKHLDLRNNKLLGFGIAFSKFKSRYLITRDLTLEQLKYIFRMFNAIKCKKVLHNSYFDITQLNYMLNMDIKWSYCTYIISHCLHTDILLKSDKKDKLESLSLKNLCKQYYPELYGYEDELEKIKRNICKGKNLLLDEFTYDLFEDSVLAPYGNYDVLVTYSLYENFKKEIAKFVKEGWVKLPYLIELKHKVTNIYIKSKLNGIGVDRNKVLELNNVWNEILKNNYEEILKDENIKKTESLLYMKEYNKLIEKRKKDYDKKIDEKINKIQNNKYTLDKLKKDKENIYNLTNKMLESIDEKSKFNLKSSQHKKVLFFEVMNLKPLKFNDVNSLTGEKTAKTDKEFLNKYSNIPLVDKIREYSLFVKGVDGFLGVNDEKKSKGLWWLTSDDYPINHPNSNLQGTITHRVAQNKINLQQLPSRQDLSILKQCIIPVDKNHRVIAMDYSSCELYILGALSNEKNLINAIKNNLDLHSNMAYEVWGKTTIINDKIDDIKKLLNIDNVSFKNNGNTLFDLDLPLVDKLLIIKELCGNMRYNAKAINFGLPYGIQEKGLAENMGVSVKDAKELLEKYMETNTGIKEFMDYNKDFLCNNGYIEGLRGQRLYMPNSKGINWRELKDWKYEDKKYILEELRKSTNYIIQSENAMILYEALIRLDNKLKELNLLNKVKLMTTIYDACYFSVDNSISNDYIKEILKEVFEVNYTNEVKFKIDIETGNNFKDLKSI